MTDEPPRETRTGVRQALASLRGWTLVQALAVIAAAAFAINAARLLNEPPHSPEPFFPNFDRAALWLGLALLATLPVAWRPSLPKLNFDADVVRSFAREHWREATLFLLILGFGIFMRTYRFGGTLPPSDGICCEEHINGGVAYLALEGQRPVLFALVRWTSAAGFLIFGEDTLGLRFFFPVLSVATLVLFYALLRNLVSVPAALFGLALYSAAWWPSLRARQTAEGTIYAVLLTLLVVRGLKTKSPLAFLGAGVVAGLISYEYESYRFVPMIVAGFFAAAAAREVLLRHPFDLPAARERALALWRIAWRPALVFAMAAGIVLTPMIVGTTEGKNLYLTSYDRQTSSRDESRIADEWRDNLRSTSTMFMPFAPTDYPTSPPREDPDTNLLDPLTASLALLGFVAGVVLVLRGYRFWFVSWVALTVVAGALLLSPLTPWSLMPVVPVLLILAMLMVDDVRALAARTFGVRGARAFGALLVLGAAFSFWWNADALYNDIAPSTTIQAGYGAEPSMIYTFCHELQERGDGNFTFAFSSAGAVDGFAAPHNTLEEQGDAWKDSIWACHDLDGAAIASPAEAWPLRDVPEGSLTLAFAQPFEPTDVVVQDLNRAYPGIGEPDKVLTGPADRYRVILYEFDSADELVSYGLAGDYFAPGASEPAVSRVDSVADLDWTAAGLPLEPPFTVRWRGVVYVDQAARLSLVPTTDDPVEVLLNGEVAFRQEGDVVLITPLDLVPGWHTVEITLDKQGSGGSFGLSWASDGREPTALGPQDIVPVARLDGWLHQRSLGLAPGRQDSVTQRLDFRPHLAFTRVPKLAAGGEVFVTMERWRGVVNVAQAADYTFETSFLSGSVVLSVDGEAVLTGEAPPGEDAMLQTTLPLEPGRHEIEVVQKLDFDVAWSGVTIAISSQGVPVTVTPY